MNFLTFEQWVKLQPANSNLNACVFCQGKKQKKCLTCDGEGIVERFYESGAEQFSCSDCDGEGFISCSYCAGTGKDWRIRYYNDVEKAKATIEAWGTMAVQL